jgi:hypothetical protein
MNDEIPEVALYFTAALIGLPTRADLLFVLQRKVGKKCSVRCMPHGDDIWLEVGGMPKKESVFVDKSQARIYYKLTGEGSPEVRVVLADDYPFRDSVKGFIKGRSVSFDESKNPLPEVRLIYAQLTKQRNDRVRAIEACASPSYWPLDTRAAIAEKMKFFIETDNNFQTFVDDVIARTLSQQDGYEKFKLWENVAEKAAERTRERILIAADPKIEKSHKLFIQEIKELTLECSGVPHLTLLDKRFNKYREMLTDWNWTRETLRFNWIPATFDWKKSWLTFKPQTYFDGDTKYVEISHDPNAGPDSSLPGLWRMDPSARQRTAHKKEK